MTIVCGTDFSAPAADAIEVAAAFARARQEELILLHSIETSPIAPALGGASDLSAAAARELERIADQLRARDLTVITRIEHGFADVSLLRAARSARCTLIVVGSVGRRRAPQWLLGSTAEKVVRGSPVPVFIVRERRSIEGWLNGQGSLGVMVATDLTPNSNAALDWTATLIDTDRPTEVTVAYVSWPPHDQKRFGLTGPMDLTQLHPALREALERELEQAASRVSPDARRVIEPNFGRQADALVAIARREKADLLVVGTRQEPGLKRLWHGSTSQGVVHNAPMNVVAVPSALSMSTIPEIGCIVAATDFSDAGNRACDYAIALAPVGSRVVLMTVTGGNDREEAARKLADIAADATVLTSATVESLIEQNANVAEAICAAAERLGANLICVGSRGRGAVAKALLGSVAQAVLTRSRQPVLIATSSQAGSP